MATFLATAALTVLANKRKERREYKRLHTLVLAAVDDALAEAKVIVEGGDNRASRAEAWAITSSYWIQVQTRYAEVCQSPTEVHDISKFFEYAVGLVNVSRALAHRSWQMELTAMTGAELPAGMEGEGQAMMRELRGRMEAQASKIKTTYWPPGYESPIYPHHPNPPRKFS